MVPNPDKCRIQQTSVKFLGHVITADGVAPDPAKLEAIAKLPVPTNVAELRRALGLFTFISKFLPDMASVSAPLRKLLKTDTAWQWDATQQSAFDRLKTLAQQPPCLALFDSSKPIRVSADASSYGLGAVLLQPVGDKWAPVAYGSRSLTSAKTRYAQIEKECLAAVWACEHFHHYLYGGNQFDLETDHKPLVPLINNADLDRTPLRCQRLLLRLMRYCSKAIHVPGKQLAVADALSRAPVTAAAADSIELSSLVHTYVSAVTSAVLSDPIVSSIRDAISDDPQCSNLRQTILQGWPRHANDLPASLRPFFPFRALLSVVDDIIYNGNRLFIPASCRAAVLAELHTGHQGIVKCRSRARAAVWWPSLPRDISTFIDQCSTCARHRTNPAEPLQPSEFPTLPWDKVACDLCDWQGRTYFIVVDYFSRYFEVACLSSTTSSAIIKALHHMFATHGIPKELVSDNGPQFRSAEFAAFAAQSGFRHRTSSPKFAQSNGEAERAVQTAKRLLRSSSDLDAALLAYRSTPLANGYSPSQLLFGRQLRSTVPAVIPPPSWPDIPKRCAAETTARQQSKKYYDTRHRARTLPTLPSGQPVYISDLNRDGTVAQHLSARSYIIAFDNGTTVRRNRRHLRALPAPTSTDFHPPPPPSTPPPDENCYEVIFGAPPPASLPTPNSPTLPDFPALLPVPFPPQITRPSAPSRRPPSTRVRKPTTRFDPSA